MHGVRAQENAARLKVFRAKLVLFPRRSKKPKSGDASAEELGVAQQHAGALMPLVHEKPALETVQLTDEMKVRALHLSGDGDAAWFYRGKCQPSCRCHASMLMKAWWLM